MLGREAAGREASPTGGALVSQTAKALVAEVRWSYGCGRGIFVHNGFALFLLVDFLRRSSDGWRACKDNCKGMA